MVGALASVVVLTMTVCDPEPPAPERDWEVEEADEFRAWSGSGEDGEDPVRSGWDYDMPTEDGRWVQFVDDEGNPRPVEAVMGAPGMWPFLTEESGEQGRLRLASVDSRRMDGGDLRLYEVLARHRADQESQEGWGFWGLVHGSEEEGGAQEATEVTLEQASALRLAVVDEDREPVEGAYLRLARESVALLHLLTTTQEDGEAVFEAIPDGDYYLNIDAEGFQQRRLRVAHGESAWEGVQITLEEGGRLRTPQAWRGPPVAEMVERSNSGPVDTTSERAETATTGAESDERGAEESAEAQSASEGELLELRIADAGGSGVTGALVEAWVNGARVDQAVSRGREPIGLRVPLGVPVDLVATHSGWGEGHHRLESVEDADDLVIRLRNERGSERVTQDRLWDRDQIEAELDARIVVSGRQWLIDPERGGLASESGVERGDALVAFRQSGELVVERSSGVETLTLNR